MKKYLSLFIVVTLIIFGVSTILFSKEGKNEKNIKSSIKIAENTSYTEKVQMAKISLINAIEIGLKKVRGKAVRAELDNENGYLVYSVIITFNNESKEVKIDAGNGKVLLVEKLNKDDDDEKEGNNDEDKDNED